MPLVQKALGPDIAAAVFRGAEEGRRREEAKELSKYRGLQMEAIQADIKTAEIARRKEERIRGLRQEALGGGPVSALGVESLGQAQDVQKIRAEQQKQLTEAITRRWPIIKAMPDGADKQAEMQSLIAAATRGGLLDENGPGSGAGAADQLSFMAQNDPQAFESVVDQVLGGDQKRLPAGGIVTFENPAGEVRRVDMTTPEGRQQALALGSEWVKRPSRQEVGEPGAFGVSKADVSKSTLAAIQSALNVTSVSQSLRKFQKAFAKAGAGAAGLRALTGEKVGGFISQFMPELGEAFTKGVAGGLSQAELADLRVNSAATVAALIQPFTGEGSARISEPERELVQDLMGTVRDPTSTPPALERSINQALKLSITILDKEAFAIGQTPIDVHSDEGIKEFLGLLSRLGMNQTTAIETVRQIQLQRELFGALGVGR